MIEGIQKFKSLQRGDDAITLENITNAHNALSDVVNKHIEYTSGIDKIGHDRDAYYCATLEGQKMQIIMLGERVDIMKTVVMIMSGMIVLNFLLLLGYLP